MITGKELEKLKIIPPDAQIYAQVKASWDKIAKPLDGLGQFETMFAQIGAITGNSSLSIEKSDPHHMRRQRHCRRRSQPVRTGSDRGGCRIYGAAGKLGW